LPLIQDCVLDVASQYGGAAPGLVTTYDKSRYHNDGTLTNVTPVQLPSGLWVNSFAGTGSINCGNDVSLDLTKALTFMFWAKFDSLGNVEMMVTRDDNVNRNFTCDKEPADKLRLIIRVGGLPTSSTHHTAMATNTWYHCAATYNKVTLETYLNAVAGTAPVAQANDVDNTNVALVIGRRSDGLFPVTGDIALLRIFNYALSPAQIRAHYHSTKWLFGVPL